MSRGKYWVFTLNHYTNVELNLVDGLCARNSCTYLIRGREIGESGTPHLQGYLELGCRARLSQVKQLGGLGRAHFELRRGTQQEAQTYCKKDDNFAEFGEPTTMVAGKRTDLDAAIDAVKAGASTLELWTEHTATMVRSGRGILEAKRALRPRKPGKTYDLSDYLWHPLPQDEVPKSEIIWGSSGIGKTSYLRSLYPNHFWVTHMDDLGNYDEDEYDGIIFDDMSFSHMPPSCQIHLVDFDDDRSIHIRYKTAFIPAGTHKVFSSNSPDIFDLSNAAVRRRLKIHEVQGVQR